jgi:outer membrane immunogenic protein
MKSKKVSGFIILGALLLLAVSTSAYGQTDYTFKGFYVGANLGGTWGNGDTDFNPLPSAATFVNLAPQTLHPDPSGFIVGGQLGYNWQHNRLVFGLEGDLGGGSTNGKETITPIVQNNGTPFPGAGFVSAHQEMNFLSTVRTRFGFVLGQRFLVYGTGGVAFAHLAYSAETNFRPVGTTDYATAFSVTKGGWTVGGGGEYLASQHWSVRGEFLHLGLGTENRTVDPLPPLPPFQVAYKFQTTSNIFRGGVNYRF